MAETNNIIDGGVSTWMEIDTQKNIIENDLLLLRGFDFDGYRQPTPDNRPEDGRKYGLIVLKGEEFCNDVNFALLDIAWRVRLEDATGKHNLLDKVMEIAKEKGRRFGFVFSCTVLKAVYTLEETNWGFGIEDELKQTMNVGDDSNDGHDMDKQNKGSFGYFSPVIPTELKKIIKSQILGDNYDFEKKPDRKLTEKLRLSLTNMIVEYISDLNLEVGNIDAVLEDVTVLSEIVRVMFADAYYSYDNKEAIENIKKEGKSVGDSYLTLDCVEKIYKSIFLFRKKNMGLISSRSTELEVILDGILEDADLYESWGLDVKKTPSE